jgi:hypothetical protein
MLRQSNTHSQVIQNTSHSHAETPDVQYQIMSLAEKTLSSGGSARLKVAMSVGDVYLSTGTIIARLAVVFACLPALAQL